MTRRVRAVLVAAATMLASGFLGSMSAADPGAKPAHLVAAEEIVRQISPQDNEYAYKDLFVHWKGFDGATRYECRADCSGFFDLLIEHVYGIKTSQIKRWTGHLRPTAAAWFDAVRDARAVSLLTAVTTLDQARPGDIVFIKYQPGDQVDTGHVMLLDSTPAARSGTAPEVPGTRQWEVHVIDCSKSGHGPDDTRHRADGTFGRGLGTGTFRFYTRTDGVVAGYSWSTDKASKFEPVSEHHVLLARLTPPAQDQ